MKYRMDRQISDEQDCSVNGQGTDKVKCDKIESYLYNKMHVPGKPDSEKVRETIQMCITEMHGQSFEYEERTGFWTYLSDVFRFEGLSIFGLQLAALIVTCFGMTAIKLISPFMPLFGLALVPVLYRSQTCGMCEMEAATRASGAQIILAKLILAGAAQLLCMTIALWLEVSVSEASDQIVQMILYVIVPFLTCMVELLRRIRTCKHENITAGITPLVVLCVIWGMTAQVCPWLYETSATGLWLVGFVVFTAFFIKEIGFIIQMRREGKIYGTIN